MAQSLRLVYGISGIYLIYYVYVVYERSLLLLFILQGFTMRLSMCSAVTSFREISFSLKSSTNLGVFKFYWRLLAARALLFSGGSCMLAIPRSLEYMKEIMAVRMVLMFQLELQVSLWQWVKVVQMDFPTSKRPLLVSILILGGEKGQSSGSQSTPWQKPSLKSSSRPQKQKWWVSCVSLWRITEGMASLLIDCSSLWIRFSVIFLFISALFFPIQTIITTYPS